jgi:[protein-PII] uridylyltransferase
VFDEEIYASVLLVVLATTLVTPPLLRWRLQRTGDHAPADDRPAERPPDGWLHVEHRVFGSVVDLAAQPPEAETMEVAMDAALRLDECTPGPLVMDWLADQTASPLGWSPTARARFLRLLEVGAARSWRFLSVTNVLERSLPELAGVVREREEEAYGFDPLAGVAFPVLAEVRRILDEDALQVGDRDLVLLAALIVDATGDDVARGAGVAGDTGRRLGLEPQEVDRLVALVLDAPLFVRTARSLNAFGEVRDEQLAQHLGDPARVEALLALALASTPGEPDAHQRFHQLARRLVQVLDHPELVGEAATTLLDARRAEALVGADHGIADRLRTAPRALVLSQSTAALARQADLAERADHLGDPAVAVHPVANSPGSWRIDVAASDARALLARVARGLHAAGHDVRQADLGVWDDGVVVTAFRTSTVQEVHEQDVVGCIRMALHQPVRPEPRAGVVVDWDDLVSPWHTVCRVTGPDEPGFLADVAAAFAVAGVVVHAAHVSSMDEAAVNTFDVSDESGDRVDAARRARVEAVISGGEEAVRRRRWLVR